MKITVVKAETRNATIPVLHLHDFEPTSDGQLSHHTDGQLRAIVPPEGWADYAREWPECSPVLLSLKREKVSASAKKAKGTK